MNFDENVMRENTPAEFTNNRSWSAGEEIEPNEESSERAHRILEKTSVDDAIDTANSNSGQSSAASAEAGEDTTSAATKMEIDDADFENERKCANATEIESTATNEENVNGAETVRNEKDADVAPESDGDEKAEALRPHTKVIQTVSGTSNAAGSDEETVRNTNRRFFGIDWAPLNIPFERRMQTFAAFFWFFCASFGIFINLIVMGFILCSSLWPLGVLYVWWIYYDRHTAHLGGRPIALVRRFKFWRHFRDYFPIGLIKTANLPPTKNYLFCVYPHGFLATGAVLNFATDANNFYKVYPGLESHLLTLSFNFNLPFSRETVLGLGGCSVAERSILNLLGGEPRGKVGVLVVGGAAESEKSEPGTYRIVIKNRKGFVRVALQSGAALVPVFSFGENDLYGQYKNKSISAFQNFVRKCFGFVPLIPRGRGFFQYSFGLVPYRRPINTVVGKSIDVPKISKPTKEDIDLYHQKFMMALTDLFNEYKREYDPKGAAAELIME